MCFAYWITKATNTHSEYVILNIFEDNNGYANAAYVYVIRTSTLLVFLHSSDISTETGL